MVGFFSLTLYKEPFESIKKGRKKIEMRLFDEKRRSLKVGQLIEFTNLENKESLLCEIEEISIYKDFKDLYAHYDKSLLGYEENEVASSDDMLRYYSLERQYQYQVMAIRIKLLKASDEKYRIYKIMKMFLDNNIKLAIFDLDGTLIESTSLWADIDSTFFKRRGMEIPPNYNKEIAHIGLYAAAKLTKEKYVPNEEIDNIINEWNTLALEAYEKHIPLKDKAGEVIKILKDKNIKIALATANNEELYLPCLKRLKIYDYFDVLEDVNSCKEGKNSPEIYDKIAHRFGYKREEVVIFEDMITAQKTAFESGYFVIGINDKHSVRNYLENKEFCHVFIDDFSEVYEAIKE